MADGGFVRPSNTGSPGGSFLETETFPCPECKATVTSRPALPTWCPACNWNLLSGNGVGYSDPAISAIDRLSNERSEFLRAAILADPSELERLPPTRDALAIAALANSFSIASFLAGVVLIGWSGGFIGVLLGLFLAAGGLRTFVHVRRLPIGHKRLQRSTLPNTFSLIDEICCKLEVKPPKYIELTAEHRIVSEYRLRGSSLHVGVPFVRGVSGDELSAALAQALATLAFQSGPVSWFVENARRSLHQLSEFLNESSETQAPHSPTLPIYLDGAPGISLVRSTFFAELLINIARFIVRHPAGWVASSFTARSYKHTHLSTYRADAMAARITSPKAVVGALSAEILETSVRFALQRNFLAPQMTEKIESPAQLWNVIEEHTRQIPASERLRLLRRNSATGHRVDPELPPIGYRADILNVYNESERSDTTHVTHLSPDQFNAIWLEIAPQSNNVADEFTALFGRSLSVRDRQSHLQ